MPFFSTIWFFLLLLLGCSGWSHPFRHQWHPPHSIPELNDSAAVQKVYIWGLDLSGSMRGAGGVGGLVAVDSKVSPAEVSFVSYDGNGNVTGLTKATDGTTSAEYAYGPFGELLRKPHPGSTYASVNPFLFSTKYWDVESDFLYYGYRFYDPNRGRWLSRDPIGENGGLNLYSFCLNDPNDYIDPNGLDPNRPLDYQNRIPHTVTIDFRTGKNQAIDGYPRLNPDPRGLAYLAAYAEALSGSILAAVPEPTCATKAGATLLLIDAIDKINALDQGQPTYFEEALRWYYPDISDETINRSVGVKDLGLTPLSLGPALPSISTLKVSDLMSLRSGCAAKSTRLVDDAFDPLPMGQDVLDYTIANDPALQNVRLSVAPTFTPHIGEGVLGQATRYTAIDLESQISSLAFRNRNSLVGTIVHEEMHLRIFQRAAMGNRKCLNLMKSGADEGYVRAVEDRFLRLQNAAGR